MNFLSYSPQLQRAFEALGITLLHSLWQGFLLMLLLWTLLRFIRYEKANLRFIFAFGSLMVMLLALSITFHYEWDSLKPLPPVNQSFSTQAIGQSIELTDLEVSSDPGFWTQIKSETYTIFYQLAENAHLLAIAWFIGSLLFSFRLSLGLWQIQQLKQEKQALPEYWKAKALTFQQALGIRQNVEVCINNTLDSPLTLGWLKPMILFPASMLMAMPAEQVESILVHELAHIRRHDYLWNLLQSVAEVILFYHPAYWYIASVLEQEREHACDMITLKVTGRPQVYAQALLQVASLRTSLSTVGLSARGRGKGRSCFAERIRRIVAPQQKKKGVQPLPFFLSFCLIGFLLFAFTLKSPFEEQDLPEEEIATAAMDTILYAPYLRLYDGYGQLTVDEDGQVGDIHYLQSTGDTSQIDYAPPFAEVMKQVPDIVLDTSSLTIGDIYNQYITLDQSLNSLHKSLYEIKGLNREKVNINFSAPNVLYLLDGVATNPKSITRYSVNGLAVYPAHLLDGVDTTQFKIVVKATRKNQFQDKKSGIVHPTKKPATQPSHKIIEGRIMDAYANRGIVGVSVQAGSSKAISDERGYYQISLPDSTQITTFNFSHPNYSDKLMEVNTELTKRVYLSMFEEGKGLTITAPRLPKDMQSKEGSVIDNRIGFVDSSMYDVMKDIILIDPKTNTAKINSNVPAPQDTPDAYYTIGDPEVIFTLDGVVTDPRTVARIMVENASFETQNIPDGYLVEIRAISKEAAEAARKEQQKTVIQGTVTDQKTGKPLPGTNILIKGTTHSTIADLYGRYQIEIPQGSGELLFTYTGYETRTEAVHHKKILKVAMLPLSEKDNLNGKKLIKGRVVDEKTNEPMKGVKVYPMFDGKTPDYPLVEAPSSEDATTVTDQNGEYQLTVLSHTKYLFHSHPGYMSNAVPAKYYENFGKFPQIGNIKLKRLSSDDRKLSSQENKLIHGQVIDAETGQAIPGVNILLSGTTIGTVTDMDGKYQLQLTEDAQNLSFDARGYQKQQIAIDGNGMLDVNLLPSEAAQTSKAQENILFIIDDEVRKDIKSLKDIDEKFPKPNRMTIQSASKIDPSKVPSMSTEQLKQYTRVFIIDTHGSSMKPDNVARGKVIDDKTKKPLAGVEVSSLNDEKLKTYTDEKGEYELPLNTETKYVHHRLDGYMPFVIESKMLATFENPVLMPLRIDETSDKSALPGRKVEGKIVDAETGKPLVGVEVYSVNNEEIAEEVNVFSDQNGEFQYKTSSSLTSLIFRKAGYQVIDLPSTLISTEFPEMLGNSVSKSESTVYMHKIKDIGFEDQFKVFPNPGNDEIKVSFALPEAGSVAFELLDKEGNSLYKKEEYYNISENHETVIPSENFRPDTYLLKVTRNGESVVKRVILK